MSGFETSFLLAIDVIKGLAKPNTYGVAVWFLALIFTWSGIVKLRSPALTAMAMMDFRVVRRVHPRLGLALGAVELLLALSLAIRMFPQSSLLITTLLLWLFTLLIARSLWSGESFACFCFGNVDSRLSGTALVRTVSLAILSAMVLLAVPPDASRFLSEDNALQAILASSLLGIVILAGYLPGLLRWNRDPYGTRVATRDGGA